MSDAAQQSFSLGKADRLKSRKLIDALFKEGKKFTIAPVRVHFEFKANHPALLQAGFGVSSKVFKKATDRNRIKRICREAYRLQKNKIATELFNNDQQLILFLVYTGNSIPSMEIISITIQKILEKLAGMINKKI